jgi:hypothetical protein
MSSDPEFPNRPDHPDFDMLSDAVLTIERQMQEAIETNGMAVNDAANSLSGKYVDSQSFDYVALGRIQSIVASLPFPHNFMLRQIAELVAGVWQDGFLTASYYGDRKANGTLMVVPDTLEGLDEL